MTKLTLLCLSGMAVMLVFPRINDAAIDPSTAMGIWLLDEGSGDTAYDTSGNDNHGTINGAAWAGGKFGAALSFDGEDDFVDCGSSELLRISTGSMAAWISTNVSDDSGLSAVTLPYDDGDAWDAPWRSLGLGSWRGSLRYWLAIDGENAEMQPGDINTNQWYHLVATFDGTTRKAYLDGELKFEADTPGLITYGDPLPSLVIGDRNVNRAASGERMNGLVDDVGVFNVALGDADVKDIMNNGLQGVVAVEPSGKLATIWATVKDQRQ